MGVAVYNLEIVDMGIAQWSLFYNKVSLIKATITEQHCSPLWK